MRPIQTRSYLPRAVTALAVVLAAGVAMPAGAAPLELLPPFSSATRAAPDMRALGYADERQSEAVQDEATLDPRLRRQMVGYDGGEAPGTIVIDTAHTYLYYVLGNGRAIRYGIGVGREGFTWSGVETVARKAEWPDWHPPAEMIERQPYLPRFMAGGPGNPLGARALYLGGTMYRIHGTNDPSTIGRRVSSGCIRLTNDDIADLYARVSLGTKVVVLSRSADLGRRTAR